MLGIGVITPMMPLYAETLGATGIWLGVIYSTFSVARAIFMPVAGRLSDQKGRKGFLVMGLTIYSLVSLGYIWAGSILQMAWIRFLHGIGSAMVIPIAAAVIGDISPAGKEGSIMGTFQVALFLGFGGGPLLGGIVLDVLGMTEVFYLMGGLSVIALLLIVFLLPPTEEHVLVSSKKLSSLKTLWKHSMFRGLLTFRFANAVGRASIIAFLPIFAHRVQINPSQIGILISVNIFLTAVLQIIFGKLADRFCRQHLMIFGHIISTIPLLITPFAESFLHLILLGIVMGVGGGIAFPSAGALATELGRSHGMGNVMGYFNMAMSFGMITGPLIAGWVMDLFGLSYVFIIGGLISLLGSILCGYWIYREPCLVHSEGINSHADL